MSRLGTKQVAGSTSGSVLFLGSSYGVTEDNVNFYWDNVNSNLGVGTNTPTSSLHINSSSGITLESNNSLVNINIVRNNTTDDTITELFLDGTSSIIPIMNNSLVSFKLIITGVQTAGSNGLVGDSMIKQVEGGIKNIGGTTSIIGSVTKKSIAIDSGASTWSVFISADNVSDYLKIEVKGETGETISWTGNIELTEINY